MVCRLLVNVQVRGRGCRLKCVWTPTKCLLVMIESGPTAVRSWSNPRITRHNAHDLVDKMVNDHSAFRRSVGRRDHRPQGLGQSWVEVRLDR